MACANGQHPGDVWDTTGVSIGRRLSARGQQMLYLPKYDKRTQKFTCPPENAGILYIRGESPNCGLRGSYGVVRPSGGLDP